jgi:hypothetical protein
LQLNRNAAGKGQRAKTWLHIIPQKTIPERHSAINLDEYFPFVR